MTGINSSGQFPFSGGVAVILLALGVFIIADDPFQPTRPEVTNNLTKNTENVRSRLWQDPFEAVQLHIQEKHNNKDSDNNVQFVVEEYKQEKCYIDSKDNITVSDNKINPDKNNSTTQISPAFVSSVHDIDELRCQIQKNIKRSANEEPVVKEKEGSKSETEYKDLHIIAVMVSGGPYAEDKELRIRSRYTLTTGLLTTGYNPVDSQHIGYLDFARLCDNTNSRDENSKHSGYCGMPDVVPYELFKLSNHAKSWRGELFSENVLVLWVEDETTSKNRPLNVLSQLKKNLVQVASSKKNRLINGPKKSINNSDLKIKFDVIGPAGSTTLVKMHSNLMLGDNFCEENKCNSIVDDYGDVDNKIRVFSHRATLDDGAIRQELNTGKDKLEKIQNDHLYFPGFRRTIVTDSLLVDNLLCEMLRRGINPFHDKNYIYKPENKNILIGGKECKKYSYDALNKYGYKDYVVLLGEGDTTYSRNFKRLFQEKIKQVTNNSSSEVGHPCKSDEDIECKPKLDWLYSFFYLRGLDGEVSKSSNNASNSNNNEDSSKPGEDKKTYRRAVGANQFDYLRRLGEQISKLEKSNSHKGRIRAIGIVGSDTYDKLLILQALRNKFPDVLFFTTDLDARMLHAEENKYTRNLVVASAFGLTPDNSKYPYNGLAFRDSYQTALYHTVQDVINRSENTIHKKCINFPSGTGKQFENSKCISPVKIFEIGNRGVVDFSHDSNVQYAPGTEKQQTTDSNKAELQNKDKENKKIFYYLIFIGILLLLFLITNNRTRVYIIMVALVLVSVWQWVQSLEVMTDPEFNAMFKGTSIWPDYIIRMMASIIAILLIIYAIINLKRNTIKILTENELSKKCISFNAALAKSSEKPESGLFKKYTELLVTALKWIFCYEYYDKTEIKKYKNPGYFTCLLISFWKKNEKDTVHFSDLFYQYLYLSKPQYRFVRITLVSLLYLIVSCAILYVSSSFPVLPFVGSKNADVGSAVFITVSLSYVWLIFLVSDITRLNSQFVTLLTNDNIIWPEKKLIKYCEKYGLTEDVAIEKLKLDIIIKRSKVVDRLILLPFIVLTFILLSCTSYFDRWYMSPQLVSIIIAGAVIALFSAIRLRRTAQNARESVLLKLKEAYSALISKEEITQNYSMFGRPAKYKKMSVRLNKIIKEIEGLNTGTFAPLTQHPIVSAIALPFGGVGGFYIIDILAKMNL